MTAFLLKANAGATRLISQKARVLILRNNLRVYLNGKIVAVFFKVNFAVNHFYSVAFKQGFLYFFTAENESLCKPSIAINHLIARNLPRVGVLMQCKTNEF